MRKARIIHITRQVAALAAAALSAASHHQRIPAAGAQRIPVAVCRGRSVWSSRSCPCRHWRASSVGWLLTARRLTRPVRTVAWLVAGPLGAGFAELQSRGHQANVPLTAALDSGLGTHRRTDSAGLWRQPAGRWHRQDAGTAADDADLPRLRPRRRHQLRRIRQRQPSGHLATSRSRSDRKGAGAVPDPRRCLDDGKQTRTGPSIDEPPRGAGLDLRGDQLPAQPAQHLARSHRRRQARPRAGSRRTSPTTAATPTSSPSPAVRPAAICRRWPR